MSGKRTDDPTVGALTMKIRAARLAAGMSSRDAATKVGMDPSQWRQIEGQSRSTNVRTVERMAVAVGMRLDVVPEDGAPLTVTVCPTPAGGERVRVPSRLGPFARGLLDKIRGHREALGLTQEKVGARAGVAKSTWGNLERGWTTGGYDIGVERLQAAANAVDLEVALIAPHHRRFLDLDAAEAEQLIKLTRWYCGWALRCPDMLRGVRDKLTGNYRDAERAA